VESFEDVHMTWRTIVNWSLVGSGVLALVALGYFISTGGEPWISLIFAGVLGVFTFLAACVVLAAGYLKS